MIKFCKGDIVSAIWPNDPKKIKRPLVIVSNNTRNSITGLQDIIVVKVTSERKKNGNIKPFNEVEDLKITVKKPSYIKCGSIFTIEKKYIKGFYDNKIQRVGSAKLKEMDSKLKIVLDL